jgi:hypothetical protein
VIIAGVDRYLQNHISELVDEAGLRSVRTGKVDRVISELKQKGRCVIVDMAWEEVQAPGVLKRFVNLSRIQKNKVIVVCPNQDEDLKKFANEAGPDRVFIRYDLLLDFRIYMKDIQLLPERRE